MATIHYSTQDSHSIYVRRSVIQALDMLDADDRGWEYVVEVLIRYTIKLTQNSLHIGADEAIDFVQDAICDFLSGKRTWSYFNECSIDTPVAIRSAFITFLKFVIKSIVRNKHRRSCLMSNESALTGHPQGACLFDSLEDLRCTYSMSQAHSKDHILHDFREDEMATSVLSTIIDMNLYTNAEIACELEIEASVVKNAKRRIARRYN